MKKLLFILIISLSSLWAKGLVQAIDSCEVYNNIKHTKNINNQRLKIGNSYQIIREQNSQYYISIKNTSVPNRWVDKKCFKNSANSNFTNKRVSKQQLLALSWQNAFCETHRYVKECKNNFSKRYTDTKFGLHGLWPQPRDNIYCGVSSENKKFDKRHKWGKLPSLNLTPEVIKELKEVMAGYGSNLHRHEWIKHGTCTNLTPNSYYKKAISLTKQINDSKVGQFFTQNIGKSVTLEQIRFKMNASFGAGSGKKVEIRCQKGMITELWIHLGSGKDNIKDLLKDGKDIYSRCKNGKIDKVGF
ncbi:Ribonuclease I precursor [hydrothermal vent metagenome]|uniref:Ribonuclease I n=1 Tax=hydrothermal vent metagenome TaxID=652676 RepID=A0A1W1CFY5_9ZZZZ